MKSFLLVAMFALDCGGSSIETVYLNRYDPFPTPIDQSTVLDIPVGAVSMTFDPISSSDGVTFLFMDSTLLGITYYEITPDTYYLAQPFVLPNSSVKFEVHTNPYISGGGQPGGAAVFRLGE